EIWLLSRLIFHAYWATHRYTHSLHGALPIFGGDVRAITAVGTAVLATLAAAVPLGAAAADVPLRTEVVQREQGRGELLLVRQWISEEHTSELQSREKLVCRLLLDKKKIRLII